jgi:tetratricopeptide (TPR) repeat protein
VKEMKIKGNGFSIYDSREELPKDLLEEGIRLLTAGNYLKALDCLSDAILHKLDYKEAYLKRSVLYFILKQYPQSLQEANEALRIDPDYAEAWAQSGFVKTETGDFESALLDYGQAIILSPGESSFLTTVDICESK